MSVDVKKCLKRCAKCKKVKEIVFFSKAGFYKGEQQYKTRCKSCIKEYSKKYYLVNSEKLRDYAAMFYRKNRLRILQYSHKKYMRVRKDTPWLISLQHARQRCENPNNPRYRNYGLCGVKCLLSASEIKFIWFRDNARMMKIPSIDRINPFGNYQLDNCRFIEFSEQNRTKRSYLQKHSKLLGVK